MQHPWLKLLTKILSSPKLVAAYLSFYFLLIVLISLHRWWQFEYYYFDHGIFDQSLWSVAHGMPPLIDHFEETGWLNQLGDHFTPSLYLLAPLYWLTSAYEPLIVLQNLFVVLAAAVMWRLSRRLKVAVWLRWALLLAFTWFLGLQNTLIAGFHTELPALLTLALSFYFLETKRWKFFWICLLLTLGFKELFVGITAGVAVHLFLQKNWKQGSAVLMLTILYYLFSTRVMIPHFSGQPYGYVSGELTPLSIPTQFFQPVMKTKTLFISLLSFGFLPLIDWRVWPVWLQDFVIRFVLATGSSAWDFGLHYSAMSSMLLYFAAIKSAQKLLIYKWYKKWNWVHALFIVLAVAGLHYKFHGPLGFGYNLAFYAQTAQHQYLRDFVRQIPNHGLTMTQNNFAVRLTHSHQVMLLREDYWLWMPDTVAIDIRAGQNPNNYWPVPVEPLNLRLQQDPNYTLQRVTNEQFIYSKNDTVDTEFYQRVGWARPR